MVYYFFINDRVTKVALLNTGSVPLDPQLSTSIEEGKNFMQLFPESATFSALSSICKTLLNNLQSD